MCKCPFLWWVTKILSKGTSWIKLHNHHWSDRNSQSYIVSAAALQKCAEWCQPIIHGLGRFLILNFGTKQIWYGCEGYPWPNNKMPSINFRCPAMGHWRSVIGAIIWNYPNDFKYIPNCSYVLVKQKVHSHNFLWPFVRYRVNGQLERENVKFSIWSK